MIYNKIYLGLSQGRNEYQGMQNQQKLLFLLITETYNNNFSFHVSVKNVGLQRFQYNSLYIDTVRGIALLKGSHRKTFQPVEG